MLIAALEAEVATFIEAHVEEKDESGHRYVVRNGRLPSREVMTCAGPIEVAQPRVRDRRGKDDPESVQFSSKILPRYLRKSRSISDVIPWLYLKGISTGGFQEALQSLLGEDAKGFSASTISRLTAAWAEEHEAWAKRDLHGKRYVYLWADGIHFNIRVEGGRQCIIVVMGATDEGKKELVGIIDGERESEQSWRELLIELKSRGLERAPEIAVGDGALGFWQALSKVFPETRHQGCWVHKTANVLNKLPKSMHPAAQDDLHQIWMAPTRKEALAAWAIFVENYEAKYPKATRCLLKDHEELLAFYDFPSKRALGAPEDDEPDRVHLRDSPPSASTNKGLGDPSRVPGDGLQAGAVRRAVLAAAERPSAAAPPDRRRRLRGRTTGREERRLIRKLEHNS